MYKKHLTRVRRQLQSSRKDLRWLVCGALLIPTITLIVDKIALLFGFIATTLLPKVGAGLLITLLLLWAYCLLLKSDLNRHKKYLKMYAPSDFDIDNDEDFDEAFAEAMKEQEKQL